MFGALLKQAFSRGAADPMDVATEMFGAMGITVATQLLECGQYPIAFQSAVKTSMQPGAKVMSMRGTDRDGGKIEALIVLAPCPESVNGA